MYCSFSKFRVHCCVVLWLKAHQYHPQAKLTKKLYKKNCKNGTLRLYYIEFTYLLRCFFTKRPKKPKKLLPNDYLELSNFVTNPIKKIHQPNFFSTFKAMLILILTTKRLVLWWKSISEYYQKQLILEYSPYIFFLEFKNIPVDLNLLKDGKKLYFLWMWKILDVQVPFRVTEE